MKSNQLRRRPKSAKQRLRSRPVAGIAEFLEAGVRGFVQKDSSVGDLMAAIRSVARGKRVVPLSVVLTGGRKKPEGSTQRTTRAGFGQVRLTTRERDVASLIIFGLDRGQIARRLRVSLRTVDRDVQDILLHCS